MPEQMGHPVFHQITFHQAIQRLDESVRMMMTEATNINGGNGYGDGDDDDDVVSPSSSGKPKRYSSQSYTANAASSSSSLKKKVSSKKSANNGVLSSSVQVSNDRSLKSIRKWIKCELAHCKIKLSEFHFLFLPHAPSRVSSAIITGSGAHLMWSFNLLA